MDKNLIKIEGIYNNLTSGEEFNIFCTMTIDLDKKLIKIKNCEVINQVKNKNLIDFNEATYDALANDSIVDNMLNIIKNLKNNENDFQGYYDYHLLKLVQFLFQYIYNEYYCVGNLTFDIIKII